MVDRYNAESDGAYLKYKLNENGDCVMYEDYQDLEAEIVKLQEKSDKFEETIAGLKNVVLNLAVLSESNTELRAENEKLQGAKVKK